ncbi:MAG: hypothetical protein HFJ32_03075 [Clostridia bacterium]|nr:hypothetical protein [Clostridia bacterium]
MENKIVYLKTYIITICLLILLFLVGIGGCVYYYENRIAELKNNTNTNQNQNTGITIVPDEDTDVNNVTAE